MRGVGGVGANTTGGDVETDVSISTRLDLRSYRLFSDAQLLAWQEAGENVHQHARETALFLGATFGFATGWDLSVLLQANRFDDFVDNGDGRALVSRSLSRTDVSQGLGDLLLLARRQLKTGGDHRLALIGGLKLPTGDVRQRTDSGEIVGTHNQPGSGSIDVQLGLGYSRPIGRLLMSADTIARINTEGAGAFRSGNSLQVDLAAGVRITPGLVASVEVNALHQQRDIERDVVKDNSGVTAAFVTPALRFSVAAHSVFAGVAIPVWQRYPGISNDESIRFSAGYGFSFGSHDEDKPHQHSTVASSR